MFSRSSWLAGALLAGSCLWACHDAWAFGQGRGGGMGGGPRLGGGGFTVDRESGGVRSGDIGGMEKPGRDRSEVDGGLHLAPPGRWWTDKSFAKKLKLRPEQQARMDSIFAQNRSALLNSYLGLQQAEGRMLELTRTPNLDEGALSAQIDRVSQARADLDKTYMHLQLQLRREMDPDQLAKLDKH